MAIQITKWQASNGYLYETLAEAETADLVDSIADILHAGGTAEDGEFSCEDAARALLKYFTLSVRDVK